MKVLKICILSLLFFLLLSSAKNTVSADQQIPKEAFLEFKITKTNTNYYNGVFIISNNSKTILDDFEISFTLNKKITKIKNGSIKKNENSNYIIKPNKISIKSNEKIEIFITVKSKLKDFPSDLKIVSIYDRLNASDLQWQQYFKAKEKEAMNKSFHEFIRYAALRFENEKPFTTYYDMIEKCPIEKITDNKFEKVLISTKDGLILTGVFFPKKQSKGTLIVLHGRTGKAYTTIRLVTFLIDSGYQVLAYDSRVWNYYKNPEKYVANIEKDIEDVGVVLNYLKRRKDVNDNKIGLYGFSQGAIKSIISANFYKNDIKIAIIDSGFPFFGLFDEKTYISNEDFILNLIPDLPKNPKKLEKYYEMINYTKSIKKVTCPILILYGQKDEYVSQYHTDTLFKNANEPKEIMYFLNSGHCNAVYSEDKDLYIKTVLNFLNKYFN